MVGSSNGFVSLGRVNDSIRLTISLLARILILPWKNKRFLLAEEGLHQKCGGCNLSPTKVQDPRYMRSQPKNTWQNGDGNLIDLVIVEAVRLATGSTEILQADILAAVADVNLCF